jgi:hypothetical protein
MKFSETPNNWDFLVAESILEELRAVRLNILATLISKETNSTKP